MKLIYIVISQNSGYPLRESNNKGHQMVFAQENNLRFLNVIILYLSLGYMVSLTLQKFLKVYFCLFVCIAHMLYFNKKR